MGIDVLGPMGVGGDTNALPPRDRVVLAALVVRPGEIVSAERLADALWREHPPPSWTKVVPGCVMRLRRLLGSSAIETTAGGYRLTLPPDEVDARRFQRLFTRGRELLALGEPERAAHVLGEALALWRGPAFSDLEGWEPGRVEAHRLEQQRLDAEEERLDAALQAGWHRQVLGDAQAQVAAVPLRERRWGLLALALYQSGRQSEALRTLHQARSILVAELGVAPGPDLIALEHAVLQQDPSLMAVLARPEPSASCPYLGLMSYDVDDAEAFFGREADAAACLGRLATVGVVAVVGPSGSGKSSLVRAGVASALRRDGRQVIVVTPDAHPMDALIALPTGGPDPVLVVDQCEHAVTLCKDSDERARFFDAMVSHAQRGGLVLALRADRVGDVSAHPALARAIEPGLYLLSAMGEADLRAAIEGPARQAGLLIESGLVDLLIRDVEGEPGALPLLSHALRSTWERREDRTLTVAGYRETGGVRGAVARSAEEIYASLPADQRRLLRDLLLRLVTPTAQGEPVRSRIPRQSVGTAPDDARLIELLVGARLVTSDDGILELAHEALARAWPRLRGWLDDDVDGQRIMRHLAGAAEAWNRLGRPESELYRGTRLEQVLTWRTTTRPHLTAVELDFVDAAEASAAAEQSAIDSRARHQAQTNRRLRRLLVSVGALLVVAVCAGLLAVRGTRQADAAAVRADARRVSAQALLSEDIDLSLLMAVEAVRLDDSIDTRAAVLAALGRSPELLGAGRAESPLRTVEVAPVERTIAVRTVDNGFSFYDPDADGERWLHHRVQVAAFAFRPTGGQLALATLDPDQPGSIDTSLRLVDPLTLENQAVQLAGLPDAGSPVAPIPDGIRYSADGSSLAIVFQRFVSRTESSVAVWNLDTPDHPVLTVDVSGAADAALSNDGRLAFIGTTDPPSLAVYDVSTGSQVHAVSDGAGEIAISSDGTYLAVATERDVKLFDAATLKQLQTLRGHADIVSVLRFAHAGTLLASASLDGDVIVWDVATGTPREQLAGHADAVFGLDFDIDDGILYSAGFDGALLRWDLTGDRRFISQHAASQPEFAADHAIADPTGTTVAYVTAAWAEAGTTADLLQFRNVENGRLSNEIDTGQFLVADVAWRPHSQQLATVDFTLIQLWDADTGSRIMGRALSEPASVIGLDYTPSGEQLVVTQGQVEGEPDGGTTIFTLDADTLEPVGTPVDIAQRPTALSAGPDGRAILLTEGSRFTVVDLVEGTVLEQGDVGIDAFNVALSPDGRRAAVITTQDEFGLLDVEAGGWIAPPVPAPHDSAASASYSLDGGTVVVGGRNGAVSLWDGETGELLANVTASRTSAPVNPTLLIDGYTAIVPARDGGIYSWDTRPDEWNKYACAAAGRHLTEREWRDIFPARLYDPAC